MAAPWFDPNQFGAWYGGIAGGIGGGMGGGLGALCGFLVPRVIGRKWVLGCFYALIALGISQLLLGIYALCAGQPWAIWYGPLLAGFLLSVIVTPLAVMVRIQYRAAENRRLEAEGLRSR